MPPEPTRRILHSSILVRSCVPRAARMPHRTGGQVSLVVLSSVMVQRKGEDTRDAAWSFAFNFYLFFFMSIYILSNIFSYRVRGCL